MAQTSLTPPKILYVPTGKPTPMALPANLSFFMSRMQGVSTNRFKIFPNNTGTATPSKILRFELPSNSLVNLRSLQLMFSASCTGAADGGRLPPKIDSLIERVSLYAGGVLVQHGYNQYNTLRHAKDSVKGGKCSSVTGHPECVRNVSYVDGGGNGAIPPVAIATTGPEAYSSAGNRTQFCVDYWAETFFGSCEPSILDTSILPQLVMELTLSDASVLGSVAGITLDGTGATDITDDGTGAASFTMDNVHLNVEVLGLASTVLEELTARRMQEIGYVSLPFKQYFHFPSTHQGTSRFSVSTQSLDRIWLVYRDGNTFATQGGLKRIQGYKEAGAFCSNDGNTPIATATSLDIGKPTYDLGGSLCTNKEKYTVNYFNFKETRAAANTPCTYQLTVNSSSIPQFKANEVEMYAISKDSADVYKTEDCLTLDQYRNNYFVQCVRLCLPDSDPRMASGLDTRSVSASIALITEGLENTTRLDAYCECTSELRVGPGLALEVVV
jgi:hypothetical protein